MSETVGAAGAVEAAIRGMCQARVARIRRQDFDAMVDAFYAEDGLLLPSGLPAVRGREAIRAWWHESPQRGLISLGLHCQQVEGSGELAYEVGRFESTLRPKHGAPFQDSGKYLVIYRRQADGDFRAVAEMFNSDARR